MKPALRLLLIAALALAAGCAGVVEPRLPDEFKGRKQKEDPPLIQRPQAPREAAA